MNHHFFDTDLFKIDVENWPVYHPTVRQAIIDEYESSVVRTIELFSDSLAYHPNHYYIETWSGGLDSCSDSEVYEINPLT